MSDSARAGCPSAGLPAASQPAIVIPPRPALPQAAAGASAPALPPGWKIATAHPQPTLHTSTFRRRPAGFWPRALLATYVIALTLIALWPIPVDSGAGPLLRAIGRVFPVLTYARIEFGANILLFVPLGVLLALILRERYLVLPIAFLATVSIESTQALMIDRRVPTVMDIIANVAGACVGLLLVALFERWRMRSLPADPVVDLRDETTA